MRGLCDPERTLNTREAFPCCELSVDQTYGSVEAPRLMDRGPLGDTLQAGLGQAQQRAIPHASRNGCTQWTLESLASIALRSTALSLKSTPAPRTKDVCACAIEISNPHSTLR